jgi:hypothetical protein
VISTHIVQVEKNLIHLNYAVVQMAENWKTKTSAGPENTRVINILLELRKFFAIVRTPAH